MIKSMVKWGLRHLGPAQISLAWRQLRGAHGLWTFTFHRIHGPEDVPPPYHRVRTTTPDEFDHLLRLLSRKFTFVDGNQLRGFLLEGEPLPRQACLLTFDDAYAELPRFADPILQRYGAHALLFVSTGFIETGQPFWWDALLVACHDPQRTSIQAGPWESKLDDSCRLASFDEACARFHVMTSEERKTFLADLEPLAQQLPEGSDLMTWEQLGALSPQRWTIGAHTVNHCMLADLSPQEQIREWTESRKTLEERLDREIWIAAYPYGEPWQIPPSIGQHVEAAGLRAAFTQIPGIARTTTDPWRLPRLGVSARDDFYLKLSGVLDWPLWKPLLGRTT